MNLVAKVTDYEMYVIRISLLAWSSLLVLVKKPVRNLLQAKAKAGHIFLD